MVENPFTSWVSSPLLSIYNCWSTLPGIANDLSETNLFFVFVSRATLLIKLLWIAAGTDSSEALCSVVLLELHQIQPTESLCCMQDLDNRILS